MTSRERTLLTVALALLPLLFLQMLLQRSPVYDGPLYGNSSELNSYYQIRQAELLKLDRSINHNSIVFLGDSITETLIVEHVTSHGLNFGIGGDTSFGLHQRVLAYTRIQDARCLVLMIGVNDLLKRINSEIISNYEQLLTVLPAEPRLIVYAVLPVDRGYVDERIVALNLALSELLNQRANAVMVNIRPKLTDDNGDFSMHYLDDDLHLSESGYQIWQSSLEEVLTEHCPSGQSFTSSP